MPIHPTNDPHRSALTRITLVISSLGPGGAERVITTLANAWAEAGTTVTLITLTQNIPDHYPLHPRVTRVALPFLAAKRQTLGGALIGNLRRIAALRAAIREADSGITVSFIDRTNILVLLATVGLPERVFVAERCHIAAMTHSLPWPWRLSRSLLYPRAQRVIVQTAAQGRQMGGTGARSNQLAVLPNPLPAELMQVASPAATALSAKPTLVAMGRLTSQKGFDLLIEAFSRIAERHPQATLTIWGEGPERQALSELIQKKRLQGRVSLPGISATPWQELAQTSIFVLPSRFEGFPNVLLEAMALGRPCVSFDCEFGPREISADGSDAVLVPPCDVAGLAAALERLLSDPQACATLGATARSVTTRFALSAVLQEWQKTLLERCPNP